jgi:type II/III secretion system protein
VLHPVVNSLIGTNAGVPEISTRDTQTTVHLQDDETLVIGGLIQENDTRTTTKVPFLGDLPLVGRVFRNENVQGQRNELIIVVTPHIVKPGKPVLPGPAIRAIPSPPALPTLPPNAHLPPPSGQLTAARPTEANAAPARVPIAAPTATPAPAPSTTPARSPAPAPSPSAFAQTNVFTFGSPPQSNFAKPADPVQIFYATLSPAVVANGTPVRLAAITTTNASAVRLKIGTETIGLSQTGIGQWQAAFPFPAAAVPTSETNVTMTLIASRSDGTSSSIAIPVGITRP